MERSSLASRQRSSIVAERELMKYAGNHALWHKHVHNVDLDAMQILKCEEMDRWGKTIDPSCRRTGKTAIKELYNLEEVCTHPDQELGIVAPRLAQSQVNLRYMLDAIQRSEILQAFIGHQRGRRLLADTYFQLVNRSRVNAYGIMANLDGIDLTMASLEEVDDMPKERLMNRFMLALAASRRLGAAKTSRNDPKIRITGVFKGADTLKELIDSGIYHLLPIVDCYLGIELGILQEEFIMQMQKELAPDEYIRQLLCQNISATNFIWESWVRRAIQLGVKIELEIMEPVPGETFKTIYPVFIGYDAGGHGEKATSSKHSMVVIEMMGSYFVVRYAKTWSAGADDPEVIAGLMSAMRYFRPKKAIGDAYGIGVIRAVNEHCFREGITDINPAAVGDGQSVPSNWPHWFFSPLRFEGMTQHQMASAVRAAFSNGFVAMPYVDHLPMADPTVADMRLLQQQIPNMVKVPTDAAYPSYTMAMKKLGDDLFDGLMAAIWAFVNQLADNPETTILIGTRPRASLLETSHA